MRGCALETVGVIDRAILSILQVLPFQDLSIALLLSIDVLYKRTRPFETLGKKKKSRLLLFKLFPTNSCRIEIRIPVASSTEMNNPLDMAAPSSVLDDFLF